MVPGVPGDPFKVYLQPLLMGDMSGRPCQYDFTQVVRNTYY